MGADKSKLSPKDVQELSEQTDFTETEVNVWFRSFSTDCPSGKLSLEEFKNLYKKIFPNGDATSFAQHSFRTFDKNNDGLIDFREFLTALSIMSRGSFESKLEWAFDLYDQDKDGLVTKAEMLEIIDAIYKMGGETHKKKLEADGQTTEDRVDRMFARIDKDGDQSITVEEFKKAVLEDPSLVTIMQIGDK